MEMGGTVMRTRRIGVWSWDKFFSTCVSHRRSWRAFRRWRMPLLTAEFSSDGSTDVFQMSASSLLFVGAVFGMSGQSAILIMMWPRKHDAHGV